MSSFKAYPELVVDQTVSPEDGFVRVMTVSGKDFMVAVSGSKEDIERFVECWNACRKFAFPAAHIAATDEYAKRTEQLRKEAWARVESLQAELNHRTTALDEVA